LHSGSDGGGGYDGTARRVPASMCGNAADLQDVAVGGGLTEWRRLRLLSDKSRAEKHFETPPDSDDSPASPESRTEDATSRAKGLIITHSVSPARRAGGVWEEPPGVDAVNPRELGKGQKQRRGTDPGFLQPRSAVEDRDGGVAWSTARNTAVTTVAAAAAAASPLPSTPTSVSSDTGHTWPKKSGDQRASVGANGDGDATSSVGAGGAVGVRRRRRTSYDKSAGVSSIQGLFSGEGAAGVLPRVLGSGKEAWRKAAAVAATTVAAVGGSDAGERWGANRTPTLAARVKGTGGGAARNDRESRRRGSRGVTMADDREREGNEEDQSE
ncbi:unnamed protein product, partial [Laminaria digitata]